MAKQFKATTAIRYSKDVTKDGTTEHKVFEFAVGDIVSGLTAKEMAGLWDAGALEAVAAPVPAPTKVEELEVKTEVKTEDTKTEVPQGGDD